MGRPQLNNKPVLVRLPEASIEKIDALVGTYGRGKFIREAVENEIAKRVSETDDTNSDVS